MTMQNQETGLVTYQPMPAALLLVDNPDMMIEQASKAASALTKVIDKTKLYVEINDRKYLQFEAWQTCGSFFGVTAQVVNVEAIYDGQGLWHGARAWAIAIRSGVTVGGAQAICTRGEKTWASRDQHQIESMAQTRAMSKSLRSVLAFVVVLAGYAPTPAEEMGVIDSTARVVPNDGPRCPQHPARDPKEKQRNGKTVLYCTGKNGNEWCTWEVEKPRRAPQRPQPTQAAPFGKDPADIVARGEEQKAGEDGQAPMSFNEFWPKVRELGYTDPTAVFEGLRVSNMGEWQDLGLSIGQAYNLLSQVKAGAPFEVAMDNIGPANPDMVRDEGAPF